MFTLQLKSRIEQEFQRRMKLLRTISTEIEKKLEGCSGEERICMKFFYATMPLRDAGEYEFEVFLAYVRHGLFLRREMEWCRALPEDLFLHYVMYYRVNSEDISDCRAFFYSQLRERIKGLSLEEAVLEINYWCAEHVTYKASDERTISPMTAYRSGTGRCGEESTFTVSVLRSVGIGARQVYTPRWAHCGDNHAWVEVLTPSGWHFIGACEPEECLDKGWFTGASGRALIIHSRYFGTIPPETGEEGLGQEGILHYLNATERYADCRRLTLRVTDEDGKPVSGAKVSLEILNMAEFSPVAALETGKEGEVTVQIGKGDLFACAQYRNRTGRIFVPAESERAVILLEGEETSSESAEDRWQIYKLRAPKGTDRNRIRYTKEQKETQRQKFEAAKKKREERLDRYDAQNREWENTEAACMLRTALENGDEIISFLEQAGTEPGIAMLKQLTVKDYKDICAGLLMAHYKSAEPYRGQDGFPEAIQCPRIDLEELVAYRAPILNCFSQEEKKEIEKSPEAFYQRCMEKLTYLAEEEYDTLMATPSGCLRTGYGSRRSKDIFFVAVCRTLGIPARLSPVDRRPQLLVRESCNDTENGKCTESGHGAESGKCAESGNWIGVEEQTAGDNQTLSAKRQGTLYLAGDQHTKWNYGQDWTLGQLTESGFLTLDYSGQEVMNRPLTLQTGRYRLLVTNRLPDGAQHMAEQVFRINQGEEKRIQLYLPEVTTEEMFVSFEIPEFALTDPEGKGCCSTELLQDQKTIVAFLEEGKEPTEHVLNEMLEQADLLCNRSILFVLRDKKAFENATLRKVLSKLPNIKCYFGDFEADVEPLARSLYVDPDKLPLLIVIQNKSIGIYASSGYNVGSVTMITKLI